MRLRPPFIRATSTVEIICFRWLMKVSITQLAAFVCSSDWWLTARSSQLTVEDLAESEWRVFRASLIRSAELRHDSDKWCLDTISHKAPEKSMRLNREMNIRHCLGFSSRQTGSSPAHNGGHHQQLIYIKSRKKNKERQCELSSHRPPRFAESTCLFFLSLFCFLRFKKRMQSGSSKLA